MRAVDLLKRFYAPFWEPSNWLLAQDAHAFIGISIVALVAAKGYSAWWGALLILAWVLFKEPFLDYIVEGQHFFGPPWKNSGLVDASFYGLGVVLAFIALLL